MERRARTQFRRFACPPEIKKTPVGPRSSRRRGRVHPARGRHPIRSHSDTSNSTAATGNSIDSDAYDVVIVDDEASIASYLAHVVAEIPNVEIRTLQNPLDLVDQLPGGCPDLLITDNQMPQMSGIDLIKVIRAHPECPEIPIVMVTGDGRRGSRREALEAGASEFLKKPIDALEARVRVTNMLALREGQRSAERRAEWLREEVATATAEIAAREAETILSLARAVEFRDWETGSHIVRMAHYSRLIAEELGASGPDPDRIYKAAPLHDVGKIGVSDQILLKRGPLTPEELEAMRGHAQIGYEILSDCHGDILTLAATIAWTHHERYDGAGYPRGLAGDEIPLAGRIVAVADVFDALSSKRPYKRAWTRDEAFEYIRQGAGSHFDPDCVAAFLRREGDVREIAASHPG